MFKADKAVPAMAFPRIQWWALLLAAYNYELAYREGPKHGNADGLSRLPLSDTVVEVPVPGETILLMDRLEALPVCADDIADWTASDPVLQQVLKNVRQGWGDKCPDPGLQPFYVRRDELSTRTSSGAATAVRGSTHGRSWNRKDEKTWHAVISGGLGWMEISRKRINLPKYVSYRVRHPRQSPFILGSGRESPSLGYILTMLDHLWDSYF